ncbi:MAG: MaoC family dehydratase N-terminal domain-containing protein [Deltaproteobacteria bacterium]|nr:MaoC family dehydratase N-terminal domain-containing protein [Deltaproteobacteria bacterium]
MSEKAAKTGLDELAEELLKDLGKTYTPAEYVQFWGGKKYPGPFAFFNNQASNDTIRHFVDGIGDFNPLYRDKDYAGKTRYKQVLAPPAFLLSVAYGLPVPSPKPDIIGWNAGFEFEWFRPIYEGDTFCWKLVYPSDIRMKQSQMGEKSLIVYADTGYVDREGSTVAICREWVINTLREKAVKLDKYSNSSALHSYSEKELHDIYAAQDNEIIRGSEPRYWEDVKVGEELGPVVHGPQNLAETLAFLIGCGNTMCKSDRMWRRIDMYNRVITDPVTKARLNLELIHLDDRIAKMVGVPAAYDFGGQRFAWLSMLLTNWIGDDGFLWKLRGELRRFNMTGDTTWFRGRVTGKYTDNGTYCVDIDCWGENQRGEINIPGNATVILPSRKAGAVVYPQPRDVTRSSTDVDASY